MSGLSFLKLGKAGITLTHLADEHPDQPEPSCDEGQGTIDGELSESVIHNYSFVRFHYRPSKSCDLQGKKENPGRIPFLELPRTVHNHVLIPKSLDANLSPGMQDFGHNEFQINHEFFLS